MEQVAEIIALAESKEPASGRIKTIRSWRVVEKESLSRHKYISFELMEGDETKVMLLVSKDVIDTGMDKRDMAKILASAQWVFQCTEGRRQSDTSFWWTVDTEDRRSRCCWWTKPLTRERTSRIAEEILELRSKRQVDEVDEDISVQVLVKFHGGYRRLNSVSFWHGQVEVVFKISQVHWYLVG